MNSISTQVGSRVYTQIYSIDRHDSTASNCFKNGKTCRRVADTFCIVFLILRGNNSVVLISKPGLQIDNYAAPNILMFNLHLRLYIE